MRKLFAFCLMVTLAGCAGGGSGGSTGSLGALNPANWFRGAGSQAGFTGPHTLAPRRGYSVLVDTRPMVDQLVGLSLDRTPSGAILRATARVPSLGYHSADLVLVSSSDGGTLIYQFRARPPSQVTQIGSDRQREIAVAQYLSTAQLRRIRRIEVQAARNSRSLRP